MASGGQFQCLFLPDLPIDIHMLILKHLRDYDLEALRSTSTSMRAMVRMLSVRFWRDRFLIHFDEEHFDTTNETYEIAYRRRFRTHAIANAAIRGLQPLRMLPCYIVEQLINGGCSKMIANWARFVLTGNLDRGIIPRSILRKPQFDFSALHAPTSRHFRSKLDSKMRAQYSARISRIAACLDTYRT